MRSLLCAAACFLVGTVEASTAATGLQTGASRADAARLVLTKYLHAEERREAERVRYWCDPRLAPPDFLNLRQWRVADKTSSQDQRKPPLWFSFQAELQVEKNSIPVRVQRLYWVKRMADNKYRLFATCIEGECMGVPDLSTQTLDPTLRVACSLP